MSERGTVVDAVPTVALPDGRQLAYAESGACDGQPLLVCHGFPGSRLFGELLAPPARALGLRLITPDRPGLGGSSPAPGQAIGEWPNDVRVLLGRLDLATVPVLGVSAGGPYALACAAVLGTRVPRTALVSSVAPPGADSDTRGVLDKAMGSMRSRTQQTILAIAGRQIRHDADRFLLRTAARLPHPDRALYEQDAVRAVLRADLLEAFRHGSSGAVEDASAADRPWGFALEDVPVPVAFWYGALDRQVPARAAEEYAAAFPDATVKVVPDEGHLSVLCGCAEEILGWVTALEPAGRRP